MKELLQKQRKFIAVYSVWVFINVYCLLISSGDKDDFWPFDGGSMKYNYDITEFLVYVIGPLLILFVYSQFTKKD